MAAEEQHDEEINPLVPYDIYYNLIPRSDDDDARFTFLLNAANENILPEIEQNSNLEFRWLVLSEIESINRHSGNVDAFVPYLAMTYADRILSASNTPAVCQSVKKNARLFLSCCLTIASKMRNNNFKIATILQVPATVRTWVYTVDEVVEMELGICERLEWRMRPITPFCFVDFFINLLHHNSSVHVPISGPKAHQIIIKSLGVMGVIKIKPAEVGFAAVLMATTRPEDATMVDLIANILRTTQINGDSVDEVIRQLLKVQVLQLCEKEPIPIPAENGVMSMKLDWMKLAWRRLIVGESVSQHGIVEFCSALTQPASHKDKGKAKRTQPGNLKIGGKGLGRGHDGASTSKGKAKQTLPTIDEETVTSGGKGSGRRRLLKDVARRMKKLVSRSDEKRNVEIGGGKGLGRGLEGASTSKGKAKQTRPGSDEDTVIKAGGKGSGPGREGASTLKGKAKQTQPESDEDTVKTGGEGSVEQRVKDTLRGIKDLVSKKA